MSPLSRIFLAGIVAMAGTSCASTLGRPVRVTSATLLSLEVPREHTDTMNRLVAAQALVDALAEVHDSVTERDLMDRVVVLLTVQLSEHARWQESRLYPLVDRRIGGAAKFTTTLRHEHALAAEWTSELARIAAGDPPDKNRFVAVSRDLLGLERAHLATEAAVVRPILEEASAEGGNGRGP